MKHLDERVSDLVDDRLDHDERDRALVHLAACPRCREAVDRERDAKNALRTLPDAGPSEALVDKLLALAEPGEPLPGQANDSATPLPVAAWRPLGERHLGGPGPVRPPTGGHSRRKVRAMRITALAMCSTGAALVLLASLGAPDGHESPQAPVSVVPPVEEFTFEHARSTGSLPFVEPASLLVSNSGSLGEGW